MNDDILLAEKALKAFHAEARQLNAMIPSEYSAFEELLRRALYPRNLLEAFPGYPLSIFYPSSSTTDIMNTFKDGLGMAIRGAGFDDDKIDSSMVRLAQVGNGALPVDRNAFFRAIQSEADTFSFFDMASNVIVASVTDIKAGAATALSSVTGIMTTLYDYRYWLLGAAGLVALTMIKNSPVGLLLGAVMGKKKG